jgi:Tol biopolymer transport system component
MRRPFTITLIAFLLFGGCKPLTPLVTQDVQYQLTYLASYNVKGVDYQGIFGMDVGCWNETKLCFGKPELLLQIPSVPYAPLTAYNWSPDGAKIAFCAGGVNERFDIYVSDWNGDHLENITKSPANDCFVSWSKDEKLLYTVCSYEGCYAAVSDEKGNHVIKLPINLDVKAAVWTLDTKSILFVGSGIDGIAQIFIADLNGNNIKQLTNSTENSIVPVLSTNGETVFFMRTQTYLIGDFNYNIFAIDINNGKEWAITTDSKLISAAPSTAPFGNWIAFTRGRGSEYDIYVVKTDGKTLFQVTSALGDEEAPHWRTIIRTP